mgnify:CR=1 FL=1
METRNLTCIGCPMGCPLTVKIENGTVLSVEGNTCKRGAIYGKKEVTDPTRIVTTTVHVSGGVENMVSVKTQSDMPKDKIFDCIHALKNITVSAPVHIGDVILKDIAHTGVAIIATKNVQIILLNMYFSSVLYKTLPALLIWRFPKAYYIFTIFFIVYEVRFPILNKMFRIIA